MELSSTQKPYVIGAVLLGLTWVALSGDVMNKILGEMTLPPYGRSVIASFSDILVLGGVIVIAARRGPSAVSKMTGLFEDIRKPAIFAALLFIPAIIAALLLGERPAGALPSSLAWLGFGSPITEEIVFRGLAVGALVRWVGWHWLPAVLIPSLVFGLVHWGQGADMLNHLGIVAITAAGGLLFGWLYIRWDFNLWPAIFIHVGLNTIWTTFAFGETAIGGWAGNGIRLGVVIGAIALTLWMTKKPR